MKDAARQSARFFERVDARRHRSLITGQTIICLFILIAVFADFLSPYDHRAQSLREPFAPPATLHFRNSHGRLQLMPFIYAKRLVDPLERHYEEDTQRAYTLEFFVPGHGYKLFGLFPSNRHLFGVRGVDDGAPRVYFLGTDVLGRDRLSRLLIAARFSMLTGPVGTLLAALLGILIGCLSGYAGRWPGGLPGDLIDSILMRVTDAMMALPTLVMILACRAAFPLELPPARAAMLLIGIFVVLGWAEMARLTRSLVLELREREFVMAAVSIGMSPARILFKHILPNAARPLIVQSLLMLPAFLLAETSLSFLGVGVQEPEASWGSLLAVASEVSLLERDHSWVLFTPALAIMIFVMGVRLLSAGLERNEN